MLKVFNKEGENVCSFKLVFIFARGQRRLWIDLNPKSDGMRGSELLKSERV